MALLVCIRRIKGQDVLQQFAAIRGAVNGWMVEAMEGHIREHLAAADVAPAQRREDLELVVASLRPNLK